MSAVASRLYRDAARSIVTKYLKIRKGENAIIESWEHTMPLARAMVDEVRRVGGHALFVYEDEDAWWRAIDRKQEKLLGESSAPEWAALRATDVYVNFWGPGDGPRIEKDVDDALDPAFGWLGDWYGVARKTGLRGGRMTLGFVSEGRAKEWGLDRAQWERNVLRASLTDPEVLAKSGARLAKALSRGKRVRITHPNGTDLEVGLAGLPCRITDGRPRAYRKGDPSSGMLQPIPSGTLDVLLDSTTAEGTFHANRRTNIWWNVYGGGSLQFADGKLESCSMDEGRKVFERRYKSGTTGKDRASLLKFGLNPAVKDVPNLETVEGGSVSLQIGGNQGLGGSNDSSFFCWFTLAGSRIAIDGTPVVRDGRIL